MTGMKVGVVGLIVGLMVGCADGSTGPCSGKLTIVDSAGIAEAARCADVDGEVWVTGSRLEDLRGLEGLRSVRYLVVADNPNLVSLKGLDGLASAEGISLWSNPALEDVQALAGIGWLGALVALDQTPKGLEQLAGRSSGAVITRATCADATSQGSAER